MLTYLLVSYHFLSLDGSSIPSIFPVYLREDFNWICFCCRADLIWWLIIEELLHIKVFAELVTVYYINRNLVLLILNFQVWMLVSSRSYTSFKDAFTSTSWILVVLINYEWMVHCGILIVRLIQFMGKTFYKIQPFGIEI